MLVRLVFGLFVLKAAVASPRFSRQADLDTHDSTDYDHLDLENNDNYDELTDDPQVRDIMSLCKRKCLFQAFKLLSNFFFFFCL